MKKNLFFYAAAAALMLTACTSEDDVVQTAQQTVATAEDGALGFDVYVPGTTATRAGRVNVMTTETMQMTGFGVFGYQTDNAGYSTGVPNYMWNQQVNFDNSATAWYYAPLKYWPNETQNDSQEAGMPTAPTGSNIDKISLFAYAPWVKYDATTNKTMPLNVSKEATYDVGIVKITEPDGKLDGAASVANPKIQYKVAPNPNRSVDLLWGVAPAGGLTYTAVNKTPIKIEEGMPLINLVKPAVTTNMKFLFQHALARLGLKVVLAADQVSAGGKFDFGNTKVTIEEIKVSGDFGVEGILNLNNDDANVAKWESFVKADGSDADHTLTINKTNGLARHLQYIESQKTSNKQQEFTGVTTTYADVLQVSSINDVEYKKYTYKVNSPTYNASTPYFANPNDNVTPSYTKFNSTYDSAEDLPASNTKYFHKVTTANPFTNNEAYTEIKPNVTYPYATFWEDIYKLSSANTNLIQITAGNRSSHLDKTAYRLIGKTYTPTGQTPELGDWVFITDPVAEPVPTSASDKYLALPNYFMVIPTNWQPTPGKKIKVNITYWVSTEDASLNDGIVYTKNVVEKEIEMPDIANGKAYTLKLILGMTSVKLEAEVEEWKNAGAEINLPQNTAE